MAAFCSSSTSTSACFSTTRACITCSATPPHPSPLPNLPSHSTPQQPLPLARTETSVLLNRMLSIALEEEDFSTAARIRDSVQHLQRQEPTHILQQKMNDAISKQDFSKAAQLRNQIDVLNMHRIAERAKPRYPMGLVVIHRRLGYRMIIFGVDYRCRAPRRKAEDAGVGLSLRGGEQPWYHAAVDERDKAEGDNIVYVAEDDLCAAGEGVEVRHPITRIMFSGMFEQTQGFTCYIPGCRDDND